MAKQENSNSASPSSPTHENGEEFWNKSSCIIHFGDAIIGASPRSLRAGLLRLDPPPPPAQRGILLESAAARLRAQGFGHAALLSADLVASLRTLGIASSITLMERMSSRGHGRTSNSLAADTIYRLGGSRNASAVQSEFGFINAEEQGSVNKRQKRESNETPIAGGSGDSPSPILIISYGDSPLQLAVAEANVAIASSGAQSRLIPEDMLIDDYFDRCRSEEEVNRIKKIYRVTDKEFSTARRRAEAVKGEPGRKWRFLEE
eukprot:CAMPEP_0194285858 /NCGR_PEP_ID=MMETSP0169-20130528/31188_1 /TAXON_ID=218684 /ORGANISM="Corethron pennatum, Strain L29A3" /LENGTH=261 /DNA_ID=CAMNT_0039032087 /DNA_START=35 /DNA_END=817 /DNA_ORIENTATION=-